MHIKYILLVISKEEHDKFKKNYPAEYDQLITKPMFLGICIKCHGENNDLLHLFRYDYTFAKYTDNTQEIIKIKSILDMVSEGKLIITYSDDSTRTINVKLSSKN